MDEISPWLIFYSSRVSMLGNGKTTNLSSSKKVLLAKVIIGGNKVQTRGKALPAKVIMGLG